MEDPESFFPAPICGSVLGNLREALQPCQMVKICKAPSTTVLLSLIFLHPMNAMGSLVRRWAHEQNLLPSERSGLVENVSAHGGGMELDNLKSPFLL